MSSHICKFPKLFLVQNPKMESNRCKSFRFGELIPELQKAPVPLLHILASCHSLSVLNGQLIGDPLDVKMFEATHWVSLKLRERLLHNYGTCLKYF